jgi:glycosyltransferase involved in cell wall biosynthesis
VRVAVLSSTPASPIEGSGTYVALAGLVAGLRQRGHAVEVRPLGRRTRFHTFDRWRYNATLALDPPEADAVIGVDLDGFLWAGRSPRWRRRPHGPVPGVRGRPRFVVSLKGVIADERTHERGWVRSLLGVQARWERLNVSRADAVVAPSRYAASAAARWYGIDDHRIAIIPEPVDVSGWRARLASVERRPPDGVTVLSVARMYPRKHLGDLLVAAGLLRTRIPALRVRIVGNGPEYHALVGRHAALGLGDGVRLLGDVSAHALAVEYASANVFCLPSRQEAFGVVFAEAMAAGLPVVACRAAAVPEVVDDGHTGILVAPGQPAQLAGAIERLVRDEELRRRLGQAGLERVERFDVPRIAATWERVLAS